MGEMAMPWQAYLVAADQGEGGEVFTKKTSEIFSRMQMARNESFARVRATEASMMSPRGGGGGGHQTLGSTYSGSLAVGAGMDHYNYDHMMNLEIREDAEGHVFVKDLSLIPVTNVQEVMAVVNLGLKLRATHETKMNQVSSRSHTVFTVTVMQKDRMNGEAVSGTLHLVDLAGSERLKKSDSQGMRLREALHINSSLTALGKVVVALDPSAERYHVPYRDSKLTRILQNSLGGNSYTAVVATVHPLVDYSEECLSSLQFANRCRNVQNQPRVNYIASTEADKDKRIKRLMDEVASLQQKIRGMRDEHNHHVTAMLRSLGMKAMVLPDGSVELSDGRKIGSSGVLTDSVRMDGRRGSEIDFESSRMADMAQAMVTRLKNTIDSMQVEIQELKKEINDKKKEIENLKQHAQKLQDHHDDMRRKWQSDNKGLQALYDKKCRKFRDYATITAAAHEQQTRNIVQNNHLLLEEHYRLLQSIPQSLRSHSDALAQAREADKRSRVEEQARSNAQIKGMELGKNAELENLRQQYEYWLKKKHEEIATFTTSFNQYRQRYRTERAVQSEELITLYDYAVALKRMLDRAESGAYQLQQVGGSVSLQIPRAEKPRDLLGDSRTLKITHRLLEKRKRQTLELQKMEHETTMALAQCLGLNEAEARVHLEDVMRLHQDSDTKPKKRLARHMTTRTLRASASSKSWRKRRPQSAYPILHDVEGHDKAQVTRRLRPQSAPQKLMARLLSPSVASAVVLDWDSDNSSEGPLLPKEESVSPIAQQAKTTTTLAPEPASPPPPIPETIPAPRKKAPHGVSSHTVFSNYSDEEDYGMNAPPGYKGEGNGEGEEEEDGGDIQGLAPPLGPNLHSVSMYVMPGDNDELDQSFGGPITPNAGSNSRTIFADYDDDDRVPLSGTSRQQFIYDEGGDDQDGYEPPPPLPERDDGPSSYKYATYPPHHNNNHHNHKDAVALDSSLRLSLSVDPDRLGGLALRQLVRDYQGFIKASLALQGGGQPVEQGDDYTRGLKREVERFSRMYNDEAAKARELRAANESLKRLMAKMRESGMIMHRRDSRLRGAEKHPELPASTRLARTPVSASVRTLG